MSSFIYMSQEGIYKKNKNKDKSEVTCGKLNILKSLLGSHSFHGGTFIRRLEEFLWETKVSK